MNSSDIPARTLKAFGVNGLKNQISTDSSSSSDSGGVATYDKGFPEITMQPLSAGGIPPSGRDVNGILYALSLKEQWTDAGMGYQFSGDFSSSIGGYPKGAILPATNGTGSWLNLVDGNTVSPESVPSVTTGWVPIMNYGVSSISGLSSSSVTLTFLQSSKDRIILSGTLTANISLIFPSWMKSWTIVNNCTGNYNITYRTQSGSGITAPTGTVEKIYCDGANITREFGSSAYRNVGNEAGQIPDMSYFSSNPSSSSGSFNFPNAVIKTGTTTVSGTDGIATGTFDSPFKTACLGVFLVETTAITSGFNSVCVWALAIGETTRAGFKAIAVNRTNPAYVSGESAGYFAIGY